MPITPSLSILEQRRTARHQINFKAMGEHRARGDIWLELVNISIDGFMLAKADGLARGDRITLRLPIAGYIEAFCTWEADGRVGFQFERPLRVGEFPEIVSAMQRRKA